MKRKKYKIQWIVRDTIFTGDFSKKGKYHTIENVVAVVGILGVIIGARLDNLWIMLPSIIVSRFAILPEIEDADKVKWYTKFW